MQIHYTLIVRIYLLFKKFALGNYDLVKKFRRNVKCESFRKNLQPINLRKTHNMVYCSPELFVFYRFLFFNNYKHFKVTNRTVYTDFKRFVSVINFNIITL